jgi:O-antigen/teichoic acid export membrane protein
VASRGLSLSDFGHYAVIWSITEVLYLFYQPIYTSFLPVFSAQLAKDDPTPAQETFKLAWDCMALATVPVAITLLIAPMEMIWLWTGQHDIALLWTNNLRWAISGALLNAFLFIPFAMQQSRGGLFEWVGILCTSLAIYAPVCVWLMHFYGARVGMSVWAVATFIMVIALMRKSFNSVKMPNVSVYALLSAIKTIFFCWAMGLFIYFLWPTVNTRLESLLLLASLGACLYALALLTQFALYQRMRQGFRVWRNRSAQAVSVT